MKPLFCSFSVHGVSSKLITSPTTTTSNRILLEVCRISVTSNHYKGSSSSNCHHKFGYMWMPKITDSLVFLAGLIVSKALRCVYVEHIRKFVTTSYHNW